MEIITTFLLGVILRWSTSLHDYSGHGKPPMYGDYEAQRHWQELTVNLPISKWYINSTDNNLLYWGIDYPPLTSYHSYLCGVIANWVNPKYVSLYESRGYESDDHKLFMRYTVLLADLFVYFPAVLFLVRALQSKEQFPTLAVLVLYPGLILIDHGHFQYNNISLGLFVFAVGCLLRNLDVWASVSFTLALNYKQMELYHALPIFCYLLGRCWKERSILSTLKKLIKLGVTVVLVFALCWAPFLCSLEQARAVLTRVFPFNRGLFEDKVANFWCIISVVLKVRDIFDQTKLAQICLAVTSIMSLPSCTHLLCQPTLRNLKYCLFNVSLAFFLFSYHVHEKSILLAAIPACLLFTLHPVPVIWFLLVSSLSMFPLLVRDGLTSPALIIPGIFWMIYRIYAKQTGCDKKVPLLGKQIFNLCIISMLIINVSSIFIEPPTSYPDIFPLIIALYSFLNFSVAILYFHYQQFSLTTNIYKKFK